MINVCEDDLICDFAETYRILDYKGLPPVLVATLFLGLRSDSRTKMKLANTKLTTEQALLAIIADNLAFIAWSKTKDGINGINRPKSIYKALMEAEKEEDSDIVAFGSFDEFNETRKRIIGGG